MHDWVDETNKDQGGMLIFMSDFGADLLKKNSTWLLDGTFDSVPAPFKQVK
jgi:hypothetical protein